MPAESGRADKTKSAPVSLFGTHRFEEDFRFLKGPSRRTDFWDAIKYVPLGNREEWYLSLGGELRERYVYLSNPGFGLQGLGTDDYLLHRVLLHTDIHFGEHVRAFIQLGNHLEAGKQGAVSPLEEDRLDLQQGFADISFDLDSSTRATFRAGRQEFAFGSQRLVSVRDSPNLRRSFDGFRVIFDISDARIDGFAVRPVAAERRIFDDGTDDTQSFWGVYATMPIGFAAGLNADLYYLGFKQDSARFNQGTAEERRHSIGTRLWGGYAGWDYNIELVGQFGDFGDADIRAWTVASDIGFTFGDLRLKPRLGLHADIASGDDDPNDGTLGTFNAMFPKLNYLTEAALVAPANIMDLFPSVTLKLTDSLRMIIGSDFLWRVSKDDAFYASPLNPVPGTSTADGRYIGNQLDLEAEWTIGRHIKLSFAYVHFYAGQTIEDAGGEDVDFAAVWATYRF